jgi:pseudouridine synthase
MSKERLQKILAAAGVASRRKCEEMILEGFVRVNHVVVDSLPAFADVDKDIIMVEGRRIRPQQKVYYIMNKPKGVISADIDPRGRKSAVDLIAPGERISCAGKLDTDASGAIILTNDTVLASKLVHPKYDLPKTYEVRVKGTITSEAVEQLKKGVWLSDGRTAKSSVKILNRSHLESLVQIVICEGPDRQIQRMFAKAGFKVKNIKRTQIGKIDLYGIGPGRFKPLTRAQVEYLKKVTGEEYSKP